MPSNVGHLPFFEWIRFALRPLRVPIVFLLSAFTSFCAFKDGSALLGGLPLGTASARSPAVQYVVWDADLMPNGERLALRKKSSAGFAKAVDPDVLVVYNVPSFRQLIELRNSLGLYGYSAAMSNFFCGKAQGGARWPIEVAVLSRFPIDEAFEWDPPTGQSAGCQAARPFTTGPVVARRAVLKVPAGEGLKWPVVRRKKLPGPGLLTVRIESLHAAVAAVRIPASFEYPRAERSQIAAIRRVIAASARAWVAREFPARRDFRFFAIGDFGLAHEPVTSAGLASPRRAIYEDSRAGLMATPVRIGRDRRSDLRAVNLTADLQAQGVAGSAFPHSDRVYLWSSTPYAFGPAVPADNTYGSRGFPLIVRDSGMDCSIDPHLVWMRRGPTFVGFAKQVYAASAGALDTQLRALNARRRGRGWIVTLDLDRAVLDSSQFLYEQALKCQLPSKADWRDWILAGHLSLMPGAKQFIHRVRDLAARKNGRLLLFTARDPDLSRTLIAELTRLGVMSGPNDPIVQLKFTASANARDTVWHEATTGGRRIILVLGGAADEFPVDPVLPVGGTPSSCPNRPESAGPYGELFGSQTARFGHCYFLVPGHVL